MELCDELWLVRHGESESNAALEELKSGIITQYPPGFTDRHSMLWRLTDQGRAQAQAAGNWLRKTGPFDAFFTSPYMRAMETAAELDLPDAEWERVGNLRERDYGRMDQMTHDERLEHCPDEWVYKRLNAFLWRPPTGESHQDVTNRVEAAFMTNLMLNGPRVVAVAHWGVLMAFRYMFEGLSYDQCHDIEMNKRNLEDQMPNCVMIGYRSSNPDSGEEGKPFSFRKVVHAPVGKPLFEGAWKKIERPTLSNADLRAEVNAIKPIFK